MDNTRRNGSTTRAIDLAVQELFTNGKVIIKDPYRNGTERAANKRMLDILLHRIKFEHKGPRVDIEMKEDITIYLTDRNEKIK